MTKNNKLYDIPTYGELTDEDIARAEEMYEYLEEQRVQAFTQKPKIVFKYKTLASKKDIKRICDMLKSKKIYMPTLENLNDPLESANSLLLGSDEPARKKYFENYRILSLSKNPLMSPMWAYYADNYQGVCLGFKTDNHFINIREVNYYKERDAIIFGENFVEDDLLKKGYSWRHEEEWRILQSNIQEEYFEFGGDLVCVIFGNKTKSKIRKRIERFIPNDVRVFTVKPDCSKFCLYVEKQNNCKIYSVDEIWNMLTV